MQESTRALFSAAATWYNSWLAPSTLLPVVSPRNQQHRNVNEKASMYYFVPTNATKEDIGGSHAGHRGPPLLATPSTHPPSSSAFLKGSQLSWLALYFAANLGLTLYNKFVLVRFPYPYTLTALHALCGTIGSCILRIRGVFEPRRLVIEEHIILIAFSFLYTVNIAISNLSLGLVTIPFHQVVRAATPVFVMGISYAFLSRCYSTRKVISIIPVIAGVGFATFGDYYFTTWGLCLTLLGTLLAALKTVITNVLQSPSSQTPSSPSWLAALLFPHDPTRNVIRLQLHPLELLARMSPLAFIQCVTIAALSGELSRVRAATAASSSNPSSTSSAGTRALALALMLNGVLAFLLNVVSFSANRQCGALSMTVAANVKQVLTIVFAVVLFDLTITPVNALGIGLTLVGGVWYASVEYVEKQKQKQKKQKRAMEESLFPMI